MSLLGLSKLPWAQTGVIRTGLIWEVCLLWEMFLPGLSKLPWAQKGVIYTGLIWRGLFVMGDVPARLE